MSLLLNGRPRMPIGNAPSGRPKADGRRTHPRVYPEGLPMECMPKCVQRLREIASCIRAGNRSSTLAGVQKLSDAEEGEMRSEPARNLGPKVGNPQKRSNPQCN